MFRNLGFKNKIKNISFQFWQFFSKELIEFVKKKFPNFCNRSTFCTKKKERKKEINKRLHLCVYGKVGKCSKAMAQSKTGLGNFMPARIKLGIF